MTHPPTSRDAPSARGTSALIFDRINGVLELVERALRDQLASESDVIVSLGEHVLSSGGKRMRPSLLILSAELCGYTGPRRVQMAAAIELMHTATLVHDDVVDFADLRRGRPSANAVWGNRRAVLAGDFLYGRASSLVIEDGNLDILEVFGNAVSLMAEGELLQMQRSFDCAVTETHYYRVIDRKSAALISAACEVGAILGQVTRAERRSLAEFGRELGLAFQLKDDALDYDKTAVALGKRNYVDVLEGKVTLPLLLTLKRCTNAQREEIASVVKAAGRLQASLPGRDANAPESAEGLLDIEPVVQLVDRCHGVVDTERRAEEHADRAVAAIAAFPESPAKEALLAAASYTVSRDH
jgi:octaprenyl-diphosphate synthase